MAIWNPAEELKKLEEKVATSEEDEVCTADLLLPKTAIKEAGWSIWFVEEAIGRGFKKRKGEDVGPPSWEDLEEERLLKEASQYTKQLEEIPEDMSDTPEVPGTETAETEQEVSRRLPSMRINLLDKKSQVIEELREKGFDPPEDFLWDCPSCKAVNKLNEEKCPTCSYPLHNAMQVELEWKQLKERAMQKETAIDVEVAEQMLLDASEQKIESGGKLEGKPEPSLKDIEAAFQEKAAEVEDTDTRKRVLVSEELGWLCEVCNRVWPIEYEKCISCHPEEAEKHQIPVTPPTVEHRSWDDVLKEVEAKKTPEGESLPEGVDKEKIIKDSGMKLADKFSLLLKLKAKEKEQTSVDTETESTSNPEVTG